MDVYAALVILAISWIYVIYCLINGRKITYEVNPVKKVYILVAYGIISLLIIIRLKSLFSIGLAAFMFISGLLYTSIPSGFNSQGVYISGRKYLYSKMKDVVLEDTRLSFIYRRRLHYIEVEKYEKDILERCYKYYEEKR